MRVLVTGGCGFIGSHFVKRLVAAGDDVVVLDKLTYSGNLANLQGVDHVFVQGDIADPAAVAKATEGCAAVVNFAAESHVDRSILDAGEFIRTDVLGTHVLLESVNATKARFVQVSTDEVYGDVPAGSASTEGDPLRPSSPYSASKAGGDLLVLASVRTHGVDALITRGANTYGPFQYPEKLIPLFVTNALEGEPLPVYGDVPAGSASTENDPLRPSSPYSASKAGGDLLVLASVRTHDVDALITRGANTYGPFQYPEKLIPLFVTNALEGEPLPVYGDGKQRREWLHADDHCAAIELVLRKGETGSVYNVGGEERENLEVTETILELTGADPGLIRHVADRPGHDRRYSLDSARIQALGWRRTRSLEEGLSETVAWYAERRDWWEPIKSGDYREYYEQQYGARLSG